MSLKTSISKTTAAGEQLTIVLTQANEITGENQMTTGEFMVSADAMLTFADSRTQDMNLRHLEAYQLDKYFESQIWYRVRAILGAIGGQQTIQSLAQRWETEVEETKALGQGRAEAEAKGNGSEVYEFNSEYYSVDGPRDVPLDQGNIYEVDDRLYEADCDNHPSGVQCPMCLPTTLTTG